MIKKISLKKITQKKSQKKIKNLTKSPLKPRSSSPRKHEQGLDISGYSSTVFENSKNIFKQSNQTISRSKLSIIGYRNIPKKLELSSFKKTLTPDLSTDHSTSRKNINKIHLSPNRMYEKIYKVTNSPLSKSPGNSTRDQYDIISSREYFPDSSNALKYFYHYKPNQIDLNKSSVMSCRIKSEKFSMQYYLDGHRNTVNCLCAYNDTLYTGSADYFVKKWKLQPTAVHPYKARNYLQGQSLYCGSSVLSHKKSITSVVYQDNLLISGSLDGSIKLLKNGTVSKRKIKDTIKSLKVLENVFIIGGSEKITQYELNSMKIINTWDKKQTMCMHITNNNSFISAHMDGKIKIWDIRSNKSSQEILCHNDYITGINVLNHEFITCSHDGYIKYWDFRNNLPRLSCYSDGKLCCVAVCKEKIVSGGDGIRVWDDEIYNKLTENTCKDIIYLDNMLIAGYGSSVMIWNIDKIV
jgi:WD domain, G-beta repeat